MAVSDIYANLLLVEEKELISNPERWFYKLTQNKNRSIEEEMARIYLHGAEACMPNNHSRSMHMACYGQLMEPNTRVSVLKTSSPGQCFLLSEFSVDNPAPTDQADGLHNALFASKQIYVPQSEYSLHLKIEHARKL
ncbi:hypothetical protein KIN20_027422 [Parelaphostrongylus tenuis]|uniref:Uncharacterized protein n=1 Tax=Parelaphostrongylus tenuis TaxID=148309 RepID=A0AAD5WDS3_PARTN|nr:hypothetical protein KIN20_027422 [Parelaphostrongylus tenuis]